MRVPIGFADAQHIASRLQRGRVGISVGRVGVFDPQRADPECGTDSVRLLTIERWPARIAVER